MSKTCITISIELTTDTSTLFTKILCTLAHLTNDKKAEIYNKIDGYSEKDEKTLLFIDDMTADLKRSKFIQETLKKLIYNRRHLKCNLIITAQSFTNIPLDIRKNIQNLILFKPSKKEMELIFDELFETKKDIFLPVIKNSKYIMTPI